MKRRLVWIFGGVDPSGGAGIHVDIKTTQSLGVHASSIITGLTVQNSASVDQIIPTSTSVLQAQVQSLEKEDQPTAIKIGMLGSKDVTECVSNQLKKRNQYVVLDPVLTSSSGFSLLDPKALDTLKTKLFPLVNLLTPNIPEAQAILGQKIESYQNMEHAVQELLTLGPKAVFLKGGHRHDSFAQDFFTNGKISFWLTSPKKTKENIRGTGCALASAITAGYSLGLEETDALVLAKAYVNRGIRLYQEVSKDHRVLFHAPWPASACEEDLPWITEIAEQGRQRIVFPPCEPKFLGFYPIVDRLDWAQKLIPLGIQTLQLRIKDLSGSRLETEIQKSISLAKKHNCRLFINDYWDLAIKHGAYGVHLGQEDLESADLLRLSQSGIRLGVSTHSYTEVARALSIRPSYIAIGPIFPTNTKEMKFSPQGIDGLKLWRKLIDLPLVAIGGITLEQASELISSGADGVAVISDIRDANNVPNRVNAWLERFNSHAIFSQV